MRPRKIGHVSEVLRARRCPIGTGRAICSGLLMNSFFDLQFKYCTLIWMCHSCTNNMEIDRHNGRYLRVIYSNHHLRNYLKRIALPTGIYLLKAINRNTRTRCEIFSKLTIKTLERRRRSGVFIVNFEHISHLVLVFLLLILNT